MTGNVDDEYIGRRRRVGEAHARIGLALNTYFAGMSMFMELFSRSLEGEQLESGMRAQIEESVNKLLHLDSCEGIARALEQALDRVEKQAVRTGVQLWRRSTHPCRLVIVDRAWDPLTPLLHDFHYQAMTHDVLEVRGDRYTHRYVSNEGKATEKEVVLNEADALWPRLRHQHVAEAIDMLIADFQEFMDQNHVAGLQKGQVGDLKHMAEAIKNMPQR